jgi:hypothetical protein
MGVFPMNKILLSLLLAAISLNASAAIVKSLGGTTYQFLELSATDEMDRSDVEAAILDNNSSLYGYAYASREITEQLFLSYASWDGLFGVHVDSAVVSGAEAFMNDFGVTAGGGPNGDLGVQNTSDGGAIYFDYVLTSQFIYGLTDECGMNWSCVGLQSVWYDTSGIALGALQSDIIGWDPTNPDPYIYPHDIYYEDEHEEYTGSSLLVRTSVVPIPAAAWLFASALFALVGLRRQVI